MWDVYLAFDEGEWDHANPLDLQGEELTKALLARIEDSEAGAPDAPPVRPERTPPTRPVWCRYLLRGV
jgi:hypothetical protein